MRSRCLEACAVVALSLLLLLPARAAANEPVAPAAAVAVPSPASAIPGAEPAPLRVCADPNNLPYSNAAGQGFENRIAEILASELRTTVQYVWWAQRRGFLRNTLKEKLCDVVIGLPTAVDMVLTGPPYYRSIYCFVTRKGETPLVRTFDDPRLRELRIGVQMIGDDGANSPPAHALSRRGITQNVFGYMVYGDYSDPAPASRIVDAVAAGQVDVAVVWGPQAGWFASRAKRPLTVVPVSPEIDRPYLPFAFDMSFGVRRGDEPLRDRLDAAMRRRRGDVERILDEFHVPRIDLQTGSLVASAAPEAPPVVTQP